MPDDIVETSPETEAAHPSERALDNSLDQAFRQWNGAGRQAETPEHEELEPEAKPEKPSRKPSRAAKELAERPSFDDEPDDEDTEEQEPEGKARKADKADKSKTKAEPQKDEEDDALDKLEPPENARPKTVADWHALKGKAKELKGRIKQLESELSAARRGKGGEGMDDGDPLTQEMQKILSPTEKNWKKFQGVVKSARDEAKQRAEELQAERDARESDRQELESYRNGIAAKLPPEVQKQIEERDKRISELQEHDIRTRVRTSQDYLEHFEKPITQTYDAILNELSRVQRFDDPSQQKQMDDFVARMREDGPDKIDLQGWKSRVWDRLAKDVPAADRNRLEQGILWLVNKQEQRDQTVKQWQSDPRTHTEWAARQQQEQNKKFQDAYHASLKQEEPALTKEFGQFFPYVLDSQSKQYQQKLKQIEELASKINDWSNPVAKASADARTITKAVFADELLDLVRRQDADLKFLRKQYDGMRRARSIPHQAAGVQGRSKSAPAVDIFSDKPNFGWDGDE